MVYMKLKHLPRLVNHPQFNVSLPTVLYIHGWWQDGKYEDSTLAVRGAYMKKGGFNVLTMDWKHYSFGLYFTVVLPQLKVVRNCRCLRVHSSKAFKIKFSRSARQSLKFSKNFSKMATTSKSFISLVFH